MKGSEWQMFSFVGISLLQHYWIYYKLPKIYYWQVKKMHDDMVKEDKLA